MPRSRARRAAAGSPFTTPPVNTSFHFGSFATANASGGRMKPISSGGDCCGYEQGKVAMPPPSAAADGSANYVRILLGENLFPAAIFIQHRFCKIPRNLAFPDSYL